MESNEQAQEPLNPGADVGPSPRNNLDTSQQLARANSANYQEEMEMLPSSSRVKKVLKWDIEQRRFEFSPEDEDVLRKQVITDEQQWQELAKFCRELPKGAHPSERRPSCLKGTLFGSIFAIVLLCFLYVFFIILQLALFNLIMLVVMVVGWWKLCKVFWAMLMRILDNGRKAPFKSYMKKMRDMGWLKEKGIEI